MILDVRSPSEFMRGHIPGAANLPLLDDAERHEIGILYKQEGRHAAIERGMEIFVPKVESFLESDIDQVYCWRGGMRSGVVAKLTGATILKGGYKAWRRESRRQFSLPRSWRVVSGKTGTGKTAYLSKLREEGEQVLDLEALASHRGSSYGAIGMPEQPTQEHFENRIGDLLRRFDTGTVWVEDESRMIGLCKIPDELFAQMRGAPRMHLEISREERLDRLMADYGSAPLPELIAATLRIKKRLQNSNEVIALLERGEIRDAFNLILHYYDRTYP